MSPPLFGGSLRLCANVNYGQIEYRGSKVSQQWHDSGGNWNL